MQILKKEAMIDIISYHWGLLGHWNVPALKIVQEEPVLSPSHESSPVKDNGVASLWLLRLVGQETHHITMALAVRTWPPAGLPAQDVGVVLSTERWPQHDGFFFVLYLELDTLN